VSASTITLPAGTHIWIAADVIDMRRGFAGLTHTNAEWRWSKSHGSKHHLQSSL
jgi:hypothetical protein